MTLEEVQNLIQDTNENEDLSFTDMIKLNILQRIELELEDNEENTKCSFNNNRGVTSLDGLVYELEARFNDTIEDLISMCVDYHTTKNDLEI